MFYLAVANNKVINHTLSENRFNTQQNLDNYSKAQLIEQERNILHSKAEFNIDDSDYKIITLNEISLKQLLKHHKLSNLKFNQNYSVERYQKDLQQRQANLENQIKNAQDKYVKAHKIRFSKYVDNQFYIIFSPLILFTLILLLCLNIVIMVPLILTPKIIILKSNLLLLILYILITSILCGLGSWSLLIFKNVINRNSKLENIKASFLRKHN